jgi:hypothetical protein
MSPKEKHIPDDAGRTSVCFTAAERAAIRWISEVRRTQENKRRTINDIVVDALWYYLQEKEGKTREQMEAMIPPAPPKIKAKITEIKKPKRGRTL